MAERILWSRLRFTAWLTRADVLGLAGPTFLHLTSLAMSAPMTWHVRR